jgi:hypothetical protein
MSALAGVARMVLSIAASQSEFLALLGIVTPPCPKSVSSPSSMELWRDAHWASSRNSVLVRAWAPWRSRAVIIEALLHHDAEKHP